MQKCLLVGVLALLTATASHWSASSANAQSPESGAESMAIPLQPIENSNDAFPGPAQQTYSSVAALQAKAAEEEHIEIAPKDYLRMTLRDTNLQGHSRRKARAVSITLTNTQPVRLEILQGQVLNGLDEMDVSADKAPAQEIKQQAVNFLMRGSGMVSGFGVIGANNYGASSAMAPTPVMNFANVPSGQANAPEETLTGQFVNQIKNVTLNPNQTYTFKVLVPAGSSPQVKLTFKNLKTSQVYHL